MIRYASLLLATFATPAAAQEEAMPQPPAAVAASFATPARDEGGRYLTPNRDLTAQETLWHLRVAPNVAALGCRDADEGVTVAAYNALLSAAREPLAGAQAAMALTYRARHGAAAAQARNDDAMTRLYNFFAQPTGHESFCAAAKAVLSEVATVEPGALEPYAATALPRLEAPFLAFFASWDRYRETLDRWQARRAAPAKAVAAVTATVATAAGGPVTITLTPEALRAILAGQVAGATIAAAPVAAPMPVAAPVLVASVR